MVGVLRPEAPSSPPARVATFAVGLTPERLAAEMAGAATGLTGADIAFVCQRAAMFCVKEAARGSSELSDIAIMPHHFAAALSTPRPHLRQAVAERARAHNQTLTPLAVQLKGYEALKALAGTDTHIYLGDWSRSPTSSSCPASLGIEEGSCDSGRAVMALVFLKSASAKAPTAIVAPGLGIR